MKHIIFIVLLLAGIVYFSLHPTFSSEKNHKIYDTNSHIVNVKYIGPINVQNGHFKELNIGPSTFIKSMYYDEKNRYLIVQLRDTYYQYCTIPSTTVEDWVGASSLGRYYNQNIRGNYGCRYNTLSKY